MKYISGKTILVTGGTGSWGHELVSQLVSFKDGPKEVRIYSRGEHKQVDMRNEFSDSRVKFIIGDVRDKNILGFAMKNINTVFHLAALKHVPVCEDNPWEAVLTNIYGTQNIIETSIENGVDVVVDVSTDKAVEPFNLYGVTKSCAEKLIINANNFNTKTKFVCVRGGNVIGTNGSVIPLFKKQILTNNRITVTDPTMTRFLINTREAINLIFQALEKHIGGEIFVIRMPAATVETIAKVMVSLFGDSKTSIENIGVRPGEKMHEVLVSKNESIFTEDAGKYYIINPTYRKYIIRKPLKTSEFSSSNTRRLEFEDLLTIIKKENWLFR